MGGRVCGRLSSVCVLLAPALLHSCCSTAGNHEDEGAPEASKLHSNVLALCAPCAAEEPRDWPFTSNEGWPYTRLYLEALLQVKLTLGMWRACSPR